MLARILLVGLCATLCSAIPRDAGGRLKEIPFAKIKFKTAAMLVIFYDTQRADPREISRALQIGVAASRIVSGYEFYKCDTSSIVNSKLAEESKLRGGVYIFSRTVDDGIDEFRLPLEAGHLVRYLHLRGVAGNPEDVRVFTGSDDLAALFHPSGPSPTPVFARFHEPWCSYCFKMKRVWEAAATFFKDKVAFVDVDCSNHRSFCDEQGVQSYPLLRIFAAGRKDASAALPPGGSWPASPLAPLPDGFHEYRGDWNGSRALAGLEWALQTHGRAFGADLAGTKEGDVKSVFGVRGKAPTVTLSDYSSLPPSPRDLDAAALAAALGADGRGADSPPSPAAVTVSAKGDTSVPGVTADEDEEDDEEAMWSDHFDGEEE